jgi:hypothetical protein
MMPSLTEMIQANTARGAVFGRFASVESATFANGSHLTCCNHNLEEQVSSGTAVEYLRVYEGVRRYQPAEVPFGRSQALKFPAIASGASFN